MASNRIPQTYDRVVLMLEDAADGAVAHGAAIGLKQNTEAAIRADLEALVGKPGGPGNVPPATPGVKGLRDELAQLIGDARSRGRGDRRGQVRHFVGWVPRKVSAELLQHHHRIVRHSQRIVGEPRRGPLAGPSIAQARLEHADARPRQGASVLFRQITTRTPATPRPRSPPESRPGGPASQDLVVTPGAPGSHSLFIDWDDTPRGDSFRVIITNTANPPVELKNDIIHEESETTYNDLPPGPVKVTVSARNSDGGESAPSAPVSATVP